MTETLTETELRQIEARAENATPPPWECGPSYRFIGAKNASVMPFGGSAICNPNDNGGARLYPTNRKHNAEFMAHAREDVPALCRSLRAAWADVARFSKLADKRHDELCEARRQRDSLAASMETYIRDAATALRAQLAQAQARILELETKTDTKRGYL